MKKNRGWVTLVGFLLAGTGLFALILMLVGMQLSFLTWIDASSQLLGFVIRLVMIMMGIILIYMAQTGEEVNSER